MTTKKINWGIISTANICQAVLPCIINLGHNIAGLATRNKNKNKNFFKKFVIKKIYKGYQSIINDKTIDFIYLPLPNSLHYKWCVQAIKKKKNILCEKPICLISKDVEKLIKLSKKNDCIITEAVMYRHHRLIKKIKKIIDKKIIGDVVKIESNFFRYTKIDNQNIRFKDKLGGGSLYDLGYYSISLINHIFNSKPKKVLGKVVKRKGVDLKFYGEIHFANKKVGKFCSSFIDENNDSTIIVGKKGKLIIPSIFLRGEKKIIIIKNKTKKVLYANELVHRYQKEVQNLIQAVNKQKKLIVPMEESKKNVYCMENLKISSKTDKYIKL